MDQILAGNLDVDCDFPPRDMFSKQMTKLRRTTNFDSGGSWSEISRENGVRQVGCPNFESFFEFVNKGFGDGDLEYLWRGQRDAQWEVMSSLARTGKRSSSLVHNFRAAVARCTHIDYRLGPDIDDSAETELRLWSLGQHHGLVTPLVDCTIYPYVALFFAFAEADNSAENRAVFALSWGEVVHANSHIVRQFDEFKKKIYQPPYDEEFKNYLVSRYSGNFGDDINLVHESRLTQDAQNRLCRWEQAYLKKQTIRMFIPRTQENPRIHSQGGRHIYTPDDAPLETWIKQCSDNRIFFTGLALTKITIPNTERREILRALNKMNINYLSLFPDFEGAARHCNMTLFDEPRGLSRVRDY